VLVSLLGFFIPRLSNARGRVSWAARKDGHRPDYAKRGGLAHGSV
jgi:hypothetical protein